MVTQPMRLGDAVGRVSMELPTNQAVADLAYDFKGQAVVDGVLAGWGQQRFVPLIGVHSSSQISLPLYAGDGLVAKVTPARYETAEPRPYVLPPIRRRTVEAGYSDYHVQLFPFVATGSVTVEDVEIMRGKLAEAGYRFSNGDDRPDNLGRMPGGELCVLDGGAVEPLPGHRPRAGDADAWLAKVHEIYGDLYGPDGVKPQSEATSFNKRPARPQLTLLMNRAVGGDRPALNEARGPRHGQGLWRVLGLGR